MGVEYSTFEELIRNSDVLTIHVPLNAGTEGMIGREEIDAMKDGAVIINTARGKIVNEDALAARARDYTVIVSACTDCVNMN